MYKRKEKSKLSEIIYPLVSNVLKVQQQRETSQELRMLSGVTLNCQVTMMIVMNSGPQLTEM